MQSAIDNESRQLYVLLALGLGAFYAAMFLIAMLAIRWQRRAEAAAAANLRVLKRLNEIKSEFLVSISHQFRTALVGIEGFSELIRDANELDLDEVKAFARDIHSDAEQLDRAFEKMIELDQSESKRSPLPKDAVEVARWSRHDGRLQHTHAPSARRGF